MPIQATNTLREECSKGVDRGLLKQLNGQRGLLSNMGKETVCAWVVHPTTPLVLVNRIPKRRCGMILVGQLTLKSLLHFGPRYHNLGNRKNWRRVPFPP